MLALFYFSKHYAFFETNNSLHDSKASLIDEMEIQETSSNAPFTSIYGSKTPQKNAAFGSSKSQKRKYSFYTDPAFSTSIVMPSTLKPPSKPDLHRDDSLKSQWST